MQPTVAAFGTLRFPSEASAEVLPHWKASVHATYPRDGCIAYDVAEDPFDSGLIRFSAWRPDRESLSRHLQAPHLEPWRTVARRGGLMERSFTA